MLKVIKHNKNNQEFSYDKLSKFLDKIFIDTKLNKHDLLKEFEKTLMGKKLVDSLELYDILINTSLKKCVFDGKNFEDLEWSKIAQRLKLKKLYKEISIQRKTKKLEPYNNLEGFKNNIKELYQADIYDSKVIDYLSSFNEEGWKEYYDIIQPEFDLSYDFAGFNLLTSRYLIKNSGKICELPQEMYLIIAMMFADISASYRMSNSVFFDNNNKNMSKKRIHLDKTKEFYEAFASGKVSLATPILMNMRRKESSLSSCFISAISDSWLDISESIKAIGLISKNAGGVGVNISRIRAKGSWIKNQKNCSNGVTPWIKLINDTAIAVNQLNSRAGSVTVALDTWHLDIEDFLDLQTENGDQRTKAHDIFPQIVVSDLFMKRVDNKLLWTLFDSYEIRKKYNIELCELYGEEFEQQYIFLEQEARDGKIELFKQIEARSLFKKFLRTIVETGMPYVFFKDTVNNNNPNKHAGMIGNANLCVSGDTPILTEDGYKNIQEIAGTKQVLWNGEEWSESEVFKTGENQELYEVEFEHNFAHQTITKKIKMTDYHKLPIWLESIYIGKMSEFEKKAKIKDKTFFLSPNCNNYRVYELKHLKDCEEGDEIVPFRMLDNTQYYYKIKSIKKLEGLHDTYCFTEPKRNMGIFDGVLLGNCVESYSNFKPTNMIDYNNREDGETHVCNLMSLNLSLLLNDEDIAKYTKIAIEALDNTVSLSCPPVIEADIHNSNYRIIGLGQMGYADHLVKKQLAYNKPETVDYTYNLAKWIYLNALEQSADMAQERGHYPMYKGSQFQQHLFQGKKLSPFNEFEHRILDKISKYGLRNGSLTAIAPNTSTSVLLGCSSSILPVFNKFFIDKNSKGSVPIFAKYLSKDTFWYYQENKNLDQNHIINITSAWQEWTDQGISMELYIDTNRLEAIDLYNLYFNAWRKQCKTVYYIRQLKLNKEECLSCAN